MFEKKIKNPIFDFAKYFFYNINNNYSKCIRGGVCVTDKSDSSYRYAVNQDNFL